MLHAGPGGQDALHVSPAFSPLCPLPSPRLASLSSSPAGWPAGLSSLTPLELGCFSFGVYFGRCTHAQAREAHRHAEGHQSLGAWGGHRRGKVSGAGLYLVFSRRPRLPKSWRSPRLLAAPTHAGTPPLVALASPAREPLSRSAAREWPWTMDIFFKGGDVSTKAPDTILTVPETGMYFLWFVGELTLHALFFF